MKRSGHDAGRPVETAATLRREKKEKREEILRARPVSGEIDYPELSREHMARYPKIRAALAK